MGHRVHTFLLSLFFSLMMSCAILRVRSGLVLAGVGVGSAAVTARAGVKDAVGALPDAGWEGLSDAAMGAAMADAPSAGGTAVTQQPAKIAAPPLQRVADLVLRDGVDETLAGHISTLLGVTANNERFPVKEKVFDASLEKKVICASTARGKTDVIFAFRTDTEATFYLTSPSGALEKAVHATKADGPKEISIDDASVKARFEAEKAFWHKQLGDSTVANNP